MAANIRHSALIASNANRVRTTMLRKSGLMLLNLIVLCSCALSDRASDYFSVEVRNGLGEWIDVNGSFYGRYNSARVPAGEVRRIALYEVDPGRIFVLPKDSVEMVIFRPWTPILLHHPRRQKLILNDAQMRCLCAIKPLGNGCIMVLTEEMFSQPPTVTCESPPREQVH